MLDVTRTLQMAQEALYLASDVASRTDVRLGHDIELLAVQCETVCAQLKYEMLAGTV